MGRHFITIHITMICQQFSMAISEAFMMRIYQNKEFTKTPNTGNTTTNVLARYRALSCAK